MKDYGLGQSHTIDEFVEEKLRAFQTAGVSFASFFELMFRERENVMYERSEGYRLIKTTYGEAYETICKKTAKAAQVLADIPAGSVIGLAMDNSLQWIENFWALLRAGYRPLLVNLRLSDEAVAKALSDAGTMAVIADKGRQYAVRTIEASALEGEAPDMAVREFGAEVLVMSSGTTEHVKICAYTAEEFYHQINGSYDIIKKCRQAKKHYDGSLKLLTFLPFYHVFGLIAVYIWFAFFSRTFVQLNDMMPQTIVNTVKRHKVTHIFAVPLFWEKVYEQARRAIHDRGEKTEAKFERALSFGERLAVVPPLQRAFAALAFREVRDNLFGDSIQFMITGGSMIPPYVIAFFNGIGYRLANGYGMTEIGITSVELSGHLKWLNGGFVGQPMANVEYTISDDGELQVRGGVIARYVIEDGKKRERDGEWFNTHDLAEVKDGHYRLLGRQDDVIVASGGENLNPNLIEPAFDLPGVRGVCLIGAKEASGIVPVLLVSLEGVPTKERFEAISRAVTDRIDAQRLTSQIGRVAYTTAPLLQGEEFKLNRRRLQREYEAGKLALYDPAAGDVPAGMDDRLLGELRAFFGAALKKDPDTVGIHSHFFLDEGGTSLDYFAMIAAMQERFSVPFPTAEGKSLVTVTEFYDYIKAAGYDGN
ncbi:MAG: AMP-binding protein [Clostridia bacterium]|nr:AMP-binding protein [Clostridia bacterium]